LLTRYATTPALKLEPTKVEPGKLEPGKS
jgi:hypothetical protein